MSDVDIVLEIATKGVDDIYKLSNAMQQLDKVLRGVANPMKALDARSRALSAAVGSADSSLKAHAKTVGQLSRNNAVLSNELGRVRKEISSMGTDFRYASGASSSFRRTAISDLKAYENSLKKIRMGALAEDLRGVAQEQKRLGKDAQFVGRSLIIGLTTPIVAFGRYGLQALVGVDKEFVRLNKVLENVAPNIEAAAKKMNIDLTGATKEQSKQLQGMVDRYDRLDKSLTKVSGKFGLAKSITIGLAGDFAELGIQSEESIAKITALTAATEKLGDMDIGAAKDLVQSLYFQAQRAMQMSGQSRNMTFQEREIAAIGAATSQLNLFNSVENVTALTLRDLGDAFPEVAAAGSSFGLSMTELAGLLAPMKAAGFEVGASANSIKVSLQRLVAPTKQNADLFKQLTAQYGVNFTAIKGTGLDAIQSLIDGFNELKGSTAGQEGAMEFFAKVFGVRQGPRMEVAIAQLAEFDLVLKNSTDNLDSAEKKLQGFANEAIRTANASANANLPVIKSYKDIGIIARIATAQVKEGETAEIDGFGKVTLAQVKEARKIRKAVTDEIVKAQRKDGTDLIGQVNTEAGRASFIQLAGAANAAEVAQRELDVALGSLDTQLSILKNNFKSFASDVIKTIRPALEKITDISTKLITAWGNLDGKTKKLISTIVVGFASVTAAIGPLIFVFGQFRLAMSSIAGVLFSFLPSLKTMTVDAVAGSEGLLRLTKPLEVMGDTVVNTNTKFATFIATLASGDGPVGRLANKIGLMTGTLQKTTTAPVGLTREVLATTKKAKETLPALAGGTGPVSMGPLGAPTPAIDPDSLSAKSLSQRLKSSLKLQKTGVMSGAAGVRTATGAFGPMDPSDKDMLTKVEALMKKNLIDKGFPTVPGGRGPGGAFSRTVDDMVQDAIRLQAAGTTSGSAGIRTASGRFRRVTSGERESLKNFEDTRETLVKRSVSQRALSRKNIDLDIFSDQRSYKGRDISEGRASDIYRGGVKGRIAKIAEATGRAKEAGPDNIKELGGKVKGLASAPVTAFKKSIEGASTSVMALRAQHAAAGAEAPRFFLQMKTAMMGFTNATSFGTKAMKLLKLAMISSGIGAILLILAVGFILVKNNMDKFKEAGAKGLKVVGEAFKIIKNAVMELIRPIVDLFSHFGSGSEGSAGAVEGIGNAFNKLAGVLKWVAGMFAKLVEVYIKPYLYMIVNIVAAVVSLFQGKWKKAFSFLIAAVAFAVEIFINLFAIAFKIIVTLSGGLVKGVVSAFGLLGKGVIELIVLPITLILKALTSLPLGIGNKFKGVNNAFRGVVNGAKGMVDTATGAVNGVVDKAVSGTNGLIDKAAGGLKGKLKGLKKGGIAESKGKIKIGKDDVDTDPMQEQIANATGDGIEEGADEGAKALAKKMAGYAKSLKQELQTDIQDRIKGVMADVITSLTESLKTQKESSLKLFDDQLEKIDSVAKAEERLTRTKEYENKKREMEEKRALNQLNSQRNYQLAIYEGRIDDAREISLEGRKSELDAAKESAELESSRNKDLADQAKEDLVDSIKKAKEVATKYFDDAIKSFGDAAKKITEFPATTADKFNEQLEKLKTAANEYGTSAGGGFAGTFTGSLATLGVDSQAPLTAGLAAMAATIAKNNPFGPTGVWQTTIDASLEGLKQKYIGLTETLNTAVGESSGAYAELFKIYTDYKDLVAKNEAEDGAGGGAGGTGGTGGTGGGTGGNNGGYGEGFNQDGVRKGNKVAIAAANANLTRIKTYSDDYLEAKYGKTAEGKRIIAAIKGTVSSVASSSVLLGGHDKGMKDYMPVIAASKYKDQIITNSELVYAYIMNNRALFLKGAGVTRPVTRFVGGALPYGDGGATTGPVQQGIPATLHGGEYVVRNSAVKKYGWGMLQNINQGTYQPKPFENGGMIDSFAKGGMSRKPKQSKAPVPPAGLDYGFVDTSTLNPSGMDFAFYNSIENWGQYRPEQEKRNKEAKKIFMWQVSMGAINLNGMKKVWSSETGGADYHDPLLNPDGTVKKDKDGNPKPNFDRPYKPFEGWRNKFKVRGPANPSGSTGGLSITHRQWMEFGGKEFADIANDATPYEQMVIWNRVNALGYSGPNAFKYTQVNGKDTYTALKSLVRSPIESGSDNLKKLYPGVKGLFGLRKLIVEHDIGEYRFNKNSKKNFDLDSFNASLFGSKELFENYIGGTYKGREKGFASVISENDGYMQVKTGDLYSKGLELKDYSKIFKDPRQKAYKKFKRETGGEIPTDIGTDARQNFPSLASAGIATPIRLGKDGAFQRISFKTPADETKEQFMDSIFEEAYNVARRMIVRKITTPPIIVDKSEAIGNRKYGFMLDSYAKKPLSPENLIGRVKKEDTKNVFKDKNVRDYIKNALNYAYPKAYASAKFTKDYLDDTSAPASKIPLSPSNAFNVMPYDFDDAGKRSQKELLDLNAEYFSNEGRFRKVNIGLVQPGPFGPSMFERLQSYMRRERPVVGKFYNRTPDLMRVMNELQRFIQIPYKIFNRELNISPAELAKKKELQLSVFPFGSKYGNIKDAGGDAFPWENYKSQIRYRPEYESEPFRDIMRHEVGHVLGMAHTMSEADNGQQSKRPIINDANESVMSYEGTYDNENIKAGDAAYYQLLNKAIKSKLVQPFGYPKKATKKKPSRFEGGLIPEYKIGGFVGGGSKKKSTAKGGSTTSIDVRQNMPSIPWTKGNEKAYNDYFKNGYINKEGVFTPPRDSFLFPTLPAGQRWARADSLSKDSKVPFIPRPFDGMEPMYKGGKFAGKDFNVWNGKAEYERLQGKGFFSPFKNFGYHALSFLTDVKHSGRRAFGGQDIEEIFNPNAPTAARVGAGLNFGMNVAPVLKGASSLGAKAVTKNIGNLGVGTIGQGLETGIGSNVLSRSVVQSTSKPALSRLLKNEVYYRSSQLRGVMNKLSNAKTMAKENLRDFKQSNLTPFFPKSVYQKWPTYADGEVSLYDVFMPEVNARLGRRQLRENAIIEEQYQRLPRPPRPSFLPPRPPGDLPPMPAGMKGRDASGYDITHGKPFRNIFQEASANKFVRQSEGASKEIFPTLPRLLSRKVTGGMPLNDRLRVALTKGIENKDYEKKEILKAINAIKRQEPALIDGYRIPTNTGESMALARQRVANKIKNLIVPERTVESIGTTMGPDPIKLAAEARARALKQAQAREIRERVLANIEISRQGRVGGPLTAEKAFKIEELKRMGLDSSSIDSLTNYPAPEFLKMIKNLKPEDIKKIINNNYAITNSGDGAVSPDGFGAHNISLWRKELYKGAPSIPTQSAQTTAQFTFHIKHLLDQLNPANGAVKTLEINGMYAKQGIGQVDIYTLLGYIYDEFIVKHGIKQVQNSSYSAHSYSMSNMFSEVMKVLRPQTKVITPKLADWQPNNLTFGATTNMARVPFNSPEALEKFLLPSGFRPRDVSLGTPTDQMTNLVTGAGDKLKAKQTVRRIIEIRKQLEAKGMTFPSPKELIDMKYDYNLSESFFQIPGFANGGAVPGFGSQGMPALLHGGEYVVNSSAVKNIGFAALQAMNDMRFNTPKAPAYSGPVQPQQNSTSSVNIYVDNFIGEKQWFESMMKDYNINVGPQNQKNAGLQNRTISTYNGLNRGL